MKFIDTMSILSRKSIEYFREIYKHRSYTQSQKYVILSKNKGVIEDDG